MRILDKERLNVLDNHFDKITNSKPTMEFKEPQNKIGVKVYQYARSRNMSIKELNQIIIDLGFEVKHHLSLIDKESINALDKYFNKTT